MPAGPPERIPIETPPVPVGESEISARLRRHAEAARGAYAANSKRALRGDVALFTGWCRDHNRQAIPASPETVAAFVDAMASRRAPASVLRYVSSIATFHRTAGVANPCEGREVKLALRRMDRATGRARRPVAPVSDALVERTLMATGVRPRDLRDKALLAVAYTTRCRRSDLVVLRRDDLQVGADGSGTIVIRRRETDQEGQGAVTPVTQDAMRHLLAWTEAAGVADGPLLRAVLKGGRVGGAMDAGDVARIFRAMARRADLSASQAARISSHSTHVGAARDMPRYGE